MVGAGDGFRAAASVGAQRGEQAVEAALLKVVAAGARPRLDLRLVVGEERLGHPPELLLGVPEIDDLDGTGVVLRGDAPDPACSITQDHAARSEREAAPLGLAPHAPGELGRVRIGVEAGGAFDGGGVGDRARVAHGAVLLIARLGCPDDNELGLASAGGADGLLAGAPGSLARSHRDAGAVHAEIDRRSGRRCRRVRRLPLHSGQFPAQGLGGALDVLGAHPHAGQVVEQAAGLGEADQRGGRAGHAGHARGQVGARHAQRPVAREEALAAGGAVVVGALEGQRAQNGLEGLGATASVASGLPARAG